MYCSLYFSSRSNICILSELIFVIVDVLHVERPGISSSHDSRGYLTWRLMASLQWRHYSEEADWPQQPDQHPPPVRSFARTYTCITARITPANLPISTCVRTYVPVVWPQRNWRCIHDCVCIHSSCSCKTTIFLNLRTHNLLSNPTCVHTYVSSQLATISIIDTGLCLRTRLLCTCFLDHGHLSSLLHRCVFVRVASIR